MVPETVSLRAAAEQAWANAKDAQAEHERQQRQSAREGFIAAARHALRLLTNTYDSTSPLGEQDVLVARMAFSETFHGTVFGAVIEFAGERFRYYPTANSGPDSLFHLYSCPNCGQEQESDGIRSLTDLGSWLEFVATTHRCEESDA